MLLTDFDILLYDFVCACVPRVRGHMCTMTEVRGQMFLRCHPSFFLRHGHIYWLEVFWLDKAIKPQVNVCLCLPSTRVTDKEPSHELTWVLKTELRSSCLYSMYFADWAIFQALSSFESLLMI